MKEWSMLLPKALAFGVGASIFMLLIYFGVVGLISGVDFTLE